MRASMSAIGSVIIELPASFLNSRKSTLFRELTEADTAEVEVAHVSVWTGTFPATTHNPSAELRITA